MKALILLVPILLGGSGWLGYLVGRSRAHSATVAAGQAMTAANKRVNTLLGGAVAARGCLMVITNDPTTSPNVAVQAQNAETALDVAIAAAEAIDRKGIKP